MQKVLCEHQSYRRVPSGMGNRCDLLLNAYSSVKVICVYRPDLLWTVIASSNVPNVNSLTLVGQQDVMPRLNLGNGITW